MYSLIACYLVVRMATIACPLAKWVVSLDIGFATPWFCIRQTSPFWVIVTYRTWRFSAAWWTWLWLWNNEMFSNISSRYSTGIVLLCFIYIYSHNILVVFCAFLSLWRFTAFPIKFNLKVQLLSGVFQISMKLPSRQLGQHVLVSSWDQRTPSWCLGCISLGYPGRST